MGNFYFKFFDFKWVKVSVYQTCEAGYPLFGLSPNESSESQGPRAGLRFEGGEDSFVIDDTKPSPKN